MLKAVQRHPQPLCPESTRRLVSARRLVSNSQGRGAGEQVGCYCTGTARASTAYLPESMEKADEGVAEGTDSDAKWRRRRQRFRDVE